jgi:bifunctional oligoribonuclease and PAP phosphatase NrnA
MTIALTDTIYSEDAAQQIIDALLQCKKVLVTTHVRPDGDALGSAATMAMALQSSGIDAEVLLLSHLPSKYAFVFHENSIVYHDAEKGWPAALDLKNFDALLVVDTGTWSQLPGLQEKLAGFTGSKLVVDHHLTQEAWANIRLVDVKAAAAGEIVAQLLRQWGVTITPGMAAAIFLAITSDTGWFAFSNTRPTTLRLAADLIEIGVDTDRMYQLLFQNERKERLALQIRAQQSLQLLADGKLAAMKVSLDDFLQSGASVSDTENVINIPLQIRTVEVSLLFTEAPEGGPIRVSLRSKGAVNVADFAAQFGGGGHARAAGLKISGSLTSAYEAVISGILRVLNA